MTAKERLDIMQRASTLLNEAEHLANIINTTIDEAEFFKSYDRIIIIFKELCSYEKYHILTGQSPKKNLKDIQNTQKKATDNFYERRKKYLSANTNSRNYTDNEIQNFYFSANVMDIDASFTCAGELATDKGRISLFMILFFCKVSLQIAIKLIKQLEAFHVIEKKFILSKRNVLMTPSDFSKLVNLISNSEMTRGYSKQTAVEDISITSTKYDNKCCDPLFEKAGRLIINKNLVSISMLQRNLQIGFNQASQIMEQLCNFGIVSKEDGTKPRKVLMSSAQFEMLLEKLVSPLSSAHEKNQIIEMDNMEGHDFEYFCADLLRKNGFINVEVTQGSGDHGIDVLADKDDISYAIQCKCYSSNIGNAAVQQAHTGKSLYHKDIAVVMTNRYFTQQAIEEANALGVKLWDRDKLNSMIKKDIDKL